MDLLSEAKQKLGELLIIGFEGKELSDDTSAFLQQAGIGGVIYFSHNYESPEQLQELSRQIQDCRGTLPLWISIDQEGGRVQRLKNPFTVVPPAMQIAQSPSARATFDVAEMMARELKAVGVNLNYAPVADIFTNPDNTVIGDRAFGTHADAVNRVVTGVVRGHLLQGVQPCVKHFPGHGDTLLDSHEDLPVVDTDLETLRKREFLPFSRCFKSRCNMVMMAHILMTQIDPENPATLSKKIIQDILRDELRCSKLIVSDDLEMGAVTKRYSPEELPVKALNAGCNLLIYRSESAARKAYTACLEALEDGTLQSDHVIDSANLARSIKKEHLMPYEPPPPQAIADHVGCKAHQDLIDRL